MTPTITRVIPTAEAFEKFASSVDQSDGLASSHLETFLFIAKKVTREYRQFDFNTFVYHAKPYEISNEILADLFTRWLTVMSDYKKIVRIPALVFDHESYLMVG